MQAQQTVTLFGTVSNSATSRTYKTGRVFGISIISDRNIQAFHYNVVDFGKGGLFAKRSRGSLPNVFNNPTVAHWTFDMMQNSKAGKSA